METDPNRSEADTKAKIVGPMLEQLGWSFIGDEIQLEYPIKFGTATSRVDYALTIDQRPVVFVEAKPLGSDLTSVDSKQILDYGGHEHVQWCVLTNGKEVEIYNTELGEDEKKALVDKVTLQDFIEKTHVLEYISKDSIKSGKTREYAKNIMQARESTDKINQNRDVIAGGIFNSSCL